MTDATFLLLIDEARTKAESGIEYSIRYGAVCPLCGKKRIKTVPSRPWCNGIKIRYHKCDNHNCLICRIGFSIKSYQEEFHYS